MSAPRRYFLADGGPLAPQVADHLCREWPGRGPLDLSAFTVIVPTAESGRRLRETLVLRAAAADTAMLSPRILLPLDLLSDADDVHIAHPAAALSAWCRVLAGIRPIDYPRLFPERSAPSDEASRLAFAGELLALQADLARAGYRVDELPDQAALAPDLARWVELARLDRAFTRELESTGQVRQPRRAARRRVEPTSPGNRHAPRDRRCSRSPAHRRTMHRGPACRGRGSDPGAAERAFSRGGLSMPSAGHGPTTGRRRRSRYGRRISCWPMISRPRPMRSWPISPKPA